MADTTSTTRITWWAPSSPVADQDRALAFYLHTLGFEKRVDFAYGGGHRWIEVAPPGSANTIALVPPGEGQSAGGNATHCAFATDDIEADHATLRDRGADVNPEIARTGTPRSGLVSTEVTIPDPVPPHTIGIAHQRENHPLTTFLILAARSSPSLSGWSAVRRGARLVQVAEAPPQG